MLIIIFIIYIKSYIINSNTQINVSKKKVFILKNIQKEKKVLILKNIGFFNSLLQYNFSKLRLYYDVNIFVNQISCDQYHEADIIQLFSKCLRGAAYI